MSKRAILRLDGNLEQGFQVTLEVGEEGNVHSIEDAGFLPPSPELIQSLNEWRQNYHKLSDSTRLTLQEITVETGTLDQTATCIQLASELRHHLQVWLASGTFHVIDNRIREIVSCKELIRVIFRTQDKRLHLLPWHFWDFIERYPKSEIAFSAPVLQLGKVKNLARPRKKVRVLAILGNNAGINIEADRKLLEQLPQTEVVFLVEPPRQKINEQLWNQHWDILFFAGHSKTENEAGRIYINANDSLAIEDLKYGLRQAISHGLQLAIFNSCDGLGLAYELEQLCLPQLIVMREAVPDEVAQQFLKHLLTGFAEGKRFYVAVRDAREKLQGLEDKFPCASWLPIIFQNPVQPPLSWKDLRYRDIQNQYVQNSNADIQLNSDEVKFSWLKFCKNLSWAMLASSLATSFVMGLRLSGYLQPLELLAYDSLIRARPNTEKPDDRILIIAVDEEDLTYQNQHGMQRQGSSLSDEALNQLLKKLEPYKPVTIGLDIFRDRAVSLEQSDLKARLQQIISICSAEDRQGTSPAISPPEEIDIKQIGFANTARDPDNIIRRHTIGMDASKVCKTDKSFSYQLASRYLARVRAAAQRRSQGILYIGSKAFPDIENNTGGYNKAVLGGYEVMLNYRASSQIAEKVRLSDVLDGSKNNQLADLIRDRIILIGTTARSYNDYRFTPYGEKPGLEIQAHMVSQILSAVLNNRPLIWTLPQWADALWIYFWSLTGGILILHLRPKLYLLLLLSGIILFLYILCYVFLLTGAWMALVPSLMAFAATGSGIVVVKSLVRRPS